MDPCGAVSKLARHISHESDFYQKLNRLLRTRDRSALIPFFPYLQLGAEQVGHRRLHRGAQKASTRRLCRCTCSSAACGDAVAYAAEWFHLDRVVMSTVGLFTPWGSSSPSSAPAEDDEDDPPRRRPRRTRRHRQGAQGAHTGGA